MSPPTLEAITTQLQQERATLRNKLELYRVEVTQHETQLARIDQALLALSGQSFKESGTASHSARRRKPLSNSPKKSDVIRVMISILQDNGVSKPATLQTQVAELLVHEGLNRSGLAMRFKEACRDPQFIETPAGLRLAQEELESDQNQDAEAELARVSFANPK